MKVTVNGNEIELVYTIGTTYMYEKIYNEPFDITQLSKQSVVMDYLYCNILTALKSKNLPMNFSINDFIAWLDEQGGIMFLNEYALYLSKQLEIQFNLKPKSEDKEEEELKKKVKKGKKSS